MTQYTPSSTYIKIMDIISKKGNMTRKYIIIAGVVILYWVVSISMVFINKILLGGSEMKEKDAPLFVTAFQCLVTAVACLVCSSLAQVMPGIVNFPQMGSLEKEKIIKIFPLTVMFVSMMVMNNLCLKYAGVAFYNVGRSLTTMFNVIFTYLILEEKTSFKAILCCAGIIGGFTLGVDQEYASGSFSAIGVVFGILASASVSLNAIFTKKVLPVVNGSIWMLSYYNNMIAIVIFVPLIIATGELSSVYNLVTDATLDFWGLLIISGFMGFAIGSVTGLQIKVTSPLTHNISGTAKACVQTVIATKLYSDNKSVLWWLSNVVVLGSSVAYTRVKQLQMMK